MRIDFYAVHYSFLSCLFLSFYFVARYARAVTTPTAQLSRADSLKAVAMVCLC